MAGDVQQLVSRVALLHALSDLDGYGKLEGVDLSPLGETPESMIYVEHRVYMDEFAPLTAGASNNIAE
ncbi:hypothetical protein Sxan_04230 [Streptomyces xanthophaeus]|uniref:Uncharacterized protein n=1 Tax=Streptomyces xanthophaeus TaxID=67385 RepID=A0A919LG62_9ACTN|nr:hypothetical protein Sxan_04230 [Streptomyces xanthophaeus]